MTEPTSTLPPAMDTPEGFHPIAWLRDHVRLAWVPVIASFLVLVDVLGNNFIFDDYLHLYKMSNGPFYHTVLATHGGHLLSSFNTMVWFVQTFIGANASVYFLVALTIHLASVRLLFEIISRMTAKPALAAFGAALWGMCPFAQGAIGWMSVNGHVYLTAAILWVVLDLVRASENPARLTPGFFARGYLLLLIAATSFGTGFAAALGFGVVVALWDPVPSARARVIGVYGSVAIATILLYFATIQLYGNDGGSQGVVDAVGRSLVEWRKIIGLFGELTSFGLSGLLLGPVFTGAISMVPKASLQPLSLMVLAVTTVAVLVAFVLASAKTRRQLLGLMVLACIGYAMIAFARYWAVDDVSQLIRYHYMPPAIMTIIICLALSVLLDRLPNLSVRSDHVFAVWLALILVPYAMATRQNDDVMVLEQFVQFEKARAEIGRAVARVDDDWEVFIPNRPYFVQFFGGKPEDFPGLAAFFIMTYPSNVVDGRRIYFLADSPETAQMAESQVGSRISELLIYRPDLDKKKRRVGARP
jgi:hypothetical protein